MIRQLLCLMTLLSTLSATSQNVDEQQVLVYRKSGEVNLFFSDELDSIAISNYDTDSTLHDVPVSQVFYTQDTVCIVPLAEIDSVAFGNRNETVLQPNARILTPEDSTWIIRYDGSNIYFKPSTPASVLPRKGEKLFYGKQDNLFPMGLIAQVESISLLSNEYKVAVTDIELNQVFQRLFYAGRITEPSQARNATRAVTIHPLHGEISLNIEPTENVAMSGKADFTVSGKVVTNPLIGYFYMEADVENGIEAQLQCKVDDEANYESTHTRIPLGVYGLVFTPHVDVKAFLDINAELSTNIRTVRTTRQHFVYTKRAGQEGIFNVSYPIGEEGKTESQLDLTCKGEFFFGAKSTFDMNVLRETAGASLSLKAGPSFQSEVGVGLLNDMSKSYQPLLYNEAKLSACLKIGAEGSIYRRDLVWGTKTETTLFQTELSLFAHEIDLFPNFVQTRAVQNIAGAPQEVEVATKSDNEILTNVETGFQVADMNNTVVDSIFTDSIYAGQMKMQGVVDTLPLSIPAEEIKKMRVRPVFHYAGYTIPADFTSISSDPNIQPIVFGLSNGSTTVTSGLPYTGYAKTKETTYLVGAHISIPQEDSVFNTKPDIFQGSYIDTEQHELTGSWVGQEDEQDVTYTFNEDGTGTLLISGQSIVFTYHINYPQSGCISLYFDAGNKAKTLYVLRLSDDTMQYKTSLNGKFCVLERQY